MVVAKQIHTMLKTLAEKTFPEHEITGFWVSVIPKETNRHGDYSPLKKEIRIFNLSEKPEYIIATAIHELAHHCEYCIYKATGHNKRFYQVFRELLITSIKMGYVSYDAIRNQQTANDIAMLEKHFGKIDVKYDKKMDIAKDKYTIKVFNSFSIKEKLKDKDFTYNSIEQAWMKEIDKSEIDDMKAYLYTLIDKNNVKVMKANDIKVEAVYYVIVDNCYEYKDKLKSNGYIFNGYNYKKNLWVKKIRANDLKKELDMLSRMKNIKVKVNGQK